MFGQYPQLFIKDENISPERFEAVVKKFTKLVKEDGVLAELRERRYFRKPSEIRRAKEKEIERKFRKLNLNKGRYF